MDINMMRTNDGLELSSKMEMGVPLKITKVVAGAGRSDNPVSLKALTNPKQEITITGKKQQGTQSVLYTLLSNAGLNQGYDLTQVGVFALDPDKGEILYRIAQFDHAFPISAERDLPGFSIDLPIYDNISNASEVIVTIDPAGVVTQAQLAEAVQRTELSSYNTPETGTKLHMRIISKLANWISPTPPAPEPVNGMLMTEDGTQIDGKVLLDNGETADLLIIPEKAT